ncbi:MAG: transketolase C-terminal domain-containing protein [Stackebrandtia sp.]
MLKQIEGSRAVAEAVGMCRPEVVCAYPVTPQTHIVETLSAMVTSGRLAPCECVDVESEVAALSAAVGASAAGARAYTATASQGLLYMAEVLYNASGLGLPIVMTVGNRSIGAPINIWNDHSDAMSQRDSGWIQLYAETSQEALDLHIQAFQIAERLSTPVMVCVDGFVLAHAYERVDVPQQEQVDEFILTYRPRQRLDPDDPVTIGALVGPEAYTEVRCLAHAKQRRALDVIPEVAARFARDFGRDTSGLLRPYRVDDAECVVVALGSVVGTVKNVVDEMREAGVKIGAVAITSFRPFPSEAVRKALRHARRVVVLEKALAVGVGGVVSGDVRLALEADPTRVSTVIAGLGGRPVTAASLRDLFDDAICGALEELTFLDVDAERVEIELARSTTAHQPDSGVGAALRPARSMP